ncbi:SDR family oxidoreductase [Roseococcus sp. SYP-B2431]|uniref:SDR family NAD(P)-dependent oxidoreductase n=1 Tax=Roseococcus sp. SYP-B2431 TaxID=2496640 RepID=UPI00103AAF3F|nr:SDR family NAD(P)-dependent oxidoreductase [Roseococcus sp. SYP-B2431]TCH98360.1 SDR family oxidoreductase [Roseococcus sp. SYP-B2431]
MMQLEGKTALITGGANGIGAAIGKRYLEAGANLVVADHQDVAIDAFNAVQGPGRILPLKCDVTKAGDCEAVCADALAAFGCIDILVNNAGGSGPTLARTIEETTDEIFDHILELNLKPILRFSRALLPAMKRSGWGRIINMSSRVRYGVAGSFPTMKCPLGYVTAKGAMVSLTTQFGKELGPFGITCNAIAPGMILPGAEARITKIIRAQPEKWQRELVSRIPVGRTGTGEDIAELALYLASPGSGFMTGQTLDIHGGVQ